MCKACRKIIECAMHTTEHSKIWKGYEKKEFETGSGKLFAAINGRVDNHDQQLRCTLVRNTSVSSECHMTLSSTGN